MPWSSCDNLAVLAIAFSQANIRGAKDAMKRGDISKARELVSNALRIFSDVNRFCPRHVGFLRKEINEVVALRARMPRMNGLAHGSASRARRPGHRAKRG